MKDLLLGTHIYFARKGSTVDGDTVSASARPDFVGNEADIPKLGSVVQWEPKRDKTQVKLRSPKLNGGGYELRKTFNLSNELTHAFSLQEFSKIEFEILLNAAAIAPTTGAYVPNSRTEEIEGWLYLIANDQDQLKIVDEGSWVSLSMDSYQFKEGLDPHALMASVLGNSLNAGTLTNLA